jgi:hypothetical protein
MTGVIVLCRTPLFPVAFHGVAGFSRPMLVKISGGRVAKL